jgi:hypothetical protein
MRKLLWYVSRALLGASLVVGVLGVTKAFSASWDVTWVAGTVASDVSARTELERAPLGTGQRCGQFGKIADLPATQLAYTDATAPAGTLCYRARHIVTIDVGEGSPSLITKASDYSNVDATKPGNPKTLNVR